jgi:hypothetical protein
LPGAGILAGVNAQPRCPGARTKVIVWRLAGILGVAAYLALLGRYLAAKPVPSLPTLLHAFAPDTAVEASLPTEVLAMRDLAQGHQVGEFDLSPVITANTYFQQRAMEFLYPARLVRHSHAVFALVSERLPDECRALDTARAKVTLYDCAR